MADGSLDEAEILCHYRVLELTEHGERYHLPNPDGEAQEVAIEEFTIAVAINYLQQHYPGERVSGSHTTCQGSLFCWAKPKLRRSMPKQREH